MAKQFAASGNADAAFTAYSLVLNESGQIIRVDRSLYTPIDQAVGVVSGSTKGDFTRRFLSYLLSNPGRIAFTKFGSMAAL